MLTIFLFLTTLLLAYSNGANDNFKGVATLYGSGTLSYKKSISIATIATFAGSVCALFFAQGLIASFSGKGLVPQETAGSINFLIATGVGAGCTVLLATRFGFPISTTHSLVGGLLGAGIMAVGSNVNFYQLGQAFFMPLMLSPLIAFVLAFMVYRVFSQLRKLFGITDKIGIRLGDTEPSFSVAPNNLAMLDSNPASMNVIKIRSQEINSNVIFIDNKHYKAIYTNPFGGLSAQKLLDIAHVFSGSAVSFARGLNDTPKIAGLLVAAKSLNIDTGMIAIAIGMALGGLLNARRVAETMSKKIAQINHGLGFSANLVTSFLVIIASNFGVPVSTTHVSVGSIFGASINSPNKDTKVIRSILLSWIITLPTALLLSGLTYWLIT